MVAYATKVTDIIVSRFRILKVPVSQTHCMMPESFIFYQSSRNFVVGSNNLFRFFGYHNTFIICKLKNPLDMDSGRDSRMPKMQNGRF
jgi:hypothetical protein